MKAIIRVNGAERTQDLKRNAEKEDGWNWKLKFAFTNPRFLDVTRLLMPRTVERYMQDLLLP